MTHLFRAVRVLCAVCVALLAAVLVAFVQFGFVFLGPTSGLVYEIGAAFVALLFWWRWQRQAIAATPHTTKESCALVLLSATLIAAIGGVQHHWLKAGTLPKEILSVLDTTYGIAALVIVAGVTGPLLEEALFRGALLSRLRMDLGDRHAIALSAVTFVAGHFELTRWTQQLAGGVIFAIITIHTGRIWLAALAHGVSNLFGSIEPALELLHIPARLGLAWPVCCAIVAIIACLGVRRVLLTTAWKTNRVHCH